MALDRHCRPSMRQYAGGKDSRRRRGAAIQTRAPILARVRRPVGVVAGLLAAFLLLTGIEAGLQRRLPMALAHPPYPMGMGAMTVPAERDASPAMAAGPTDLPLVAPTDWPGNPLSRAWQAHPQIIVGTLLVAVLAAMLLVALFVVALMRARALDRLAWYQRELEQSLRERTEAKREAERANAAKTQFLAAMSHELRTPLNAVIGYSEIMRRELMGPLGSPRYREYAGYIHDSGQHLLEILNDMIDLAKVESGRFELSETRVSLARLVDSCLAIIRPKLEEKRIVLSCQVPPDCEVWADERAVKQILLNFLSNAVKYTPEQGRVDIRGRIDGCCRLSVRDTGIGIPEADLDAIFEPFRQGENARRLKKQGAGIGLAVSRHLAQLHGARLDIASTVGEGTEVSLIFPDDRCLGRHKNSTAA